MEHLRPESHRQILKEWKEKMGLERKSLVGSLHEISPSHSQDLIRHSFLIGIAPDVLDYRIRKDDIE
jgi:hypothetical protein